MMSPILARGLRYVDALVFITELCHPCYTLVMLILSSFVFRL